MSEAGRLRFFVEAYSHARNRISLRDIPSRPDWESGDIPYASQRHIFQPKLEDPTLSGDRFPARRWTVIGMPQPTWKEKAGEIFLEYFRTFLEQNNTAA